MSRVTKGILTIVLLATVLSVASPSLAPVAPPERLEQLRMPSPWLLAAGPGGVVTGWNARERALAQWDGEGTLRCTCRLEDMRLGHEPAFVFAGRRGRALLAFFDFTLGSDSTRQLALVDLKRCRIDTLLAAEGVVHALSAAPEGWLMSLRLGPLQGERPAVVEMDDEGRERERWDLGAKATAIAEELGLATSDVPRNGRPLAVGKEVWVLPDLAYEFWRPAQRGRSFRRLVPPPCLAATARVRSPEETAARARELATRFPAPVRQAIERQAAAGTLPPMVERATRGVAVRGNLVAVQLTDPRVEGGARVDLWDLASEEILAVVAIPATSGVLALGDGFLWLTQEGELLRRLPLPPVDAPLPDPCALVARPSRPDTAAPRTAEEDRP